MTVVQTGRLRLRYLVEGDAGFILELVNDAGWLRFIGDKDVKSVEAARGYLVRGPMAMYARLGFGLYLVELKDDGTPLGLCGLIKRDTLEDVDLGFAFLPRFRSQGYAFEAASATLDHGRSALGFERIVAIVSPDNERSIGLLRKLGMRFERRLKLGAGDPVDLFAIP